MPLSFVPAIGARAHKGNSFSRCYDRAYEFYDAVHDAILRQLLAPLGGHEPEPSYASALPHAWSIACQVGRRAVRRSAVLVRYPVEFEPTWAASTDLYLA